MRVFAVSGFSFSGKTFLLEQIIQQLTSEGLSVVSIKNSMEDIKAPEGTDTWRHSEAGATPTVLLGPNTTTVWHNKRIKIRDLTQSLSADFLLLEGFKELEVPKFWCVGEKSQEVDVLPRDVKAIVIWEGTSLDTTKKDIPIISNANITRLVDIVKQSSIDINQIADL
ncbi:MAG: molybdopterin-guanine dinucleotide biosynthesis protein B [Candidatus Thorarchaeota archaeon]